jgi:hypothetical protein
MPIPNTIGAIVLSIGVHESFPSTLYFAKLNDEFGRVTYKSPQSTCNVASSKYVDPSAKNQIICCEHWHTLKKPHKCEFFYKNRSLSLSICSTPNL